jgi:hypothetical protein
VKSKLSNENVVAYKNLAAGSRDEARKKFRGG